MPHDVAIMSVFLPRFVRRFGCFVLSCLALLIGGASAHAQATAADILAQLKGKPLFLQGLWRQDDLRFTHEGKPVQPYAAGPFTLAGIDVEKASFTGRGLEIKGRRVGLEFVKGGPRRVRLEWSGPGGSEYSGRISIIVAGHEGEDFGPALAAIFAPDLQTLMPSPERYWARVGDAYLRDADLNEAVDRAADEIAEAAVGGDPSQTAAPSSPAVPPSAASSGKPTRIGGSVKPPVLMSQVDPTFSRAARGLRYSGRVEVYLWLETTGIPTHLRVVRPAGLGLDEEALAAVAAYRFKPATQNGTPVRVDLYVDVNFQSF